MPVATRDTFTSETTTATATYTTTATPPFQEWRWIRVGAHVPSSGRLLSAHAPSSKSTHQEHPAETGAQLKASQRESLIKPLIFPPNEISNATGLWLSNFKRNGTWIAVSCEGWGGLARYCRWHEGSEGGRPAPNTLLKRRHSFNGILDFNGIIFSTALFSGCQIEFGSVIVSSSTSEAASSASNSLQYV
jgi:hypothetical protein